MKTVGMKIKTVLNGLKLGGAKETQTICSGIVELRVIVVKA